MRALMFGISTSSCSAQCGHYHDNKLITSSTHMFRQFDILNSVVHMLGSFAKGKWLFGGYIGRMQNPMGQVALHLKLNSK